MVKEGKFHAWRKEKDVGIYRYTDAGYESKDADGNWVNYAQMPQDVSHLTDAQRERLIAELRGDIKVTTRDADDELGEFMPLPEVPPVEKWPFHQAPITEELMDTGDISDYKMLPMTDAIGRAFFLASRWKAANEARRHLGYNVNDSLQDVANLNGTVLAFREMVAQLKRLSRFRKLKDDDDRPSDAARLEVMRVTGILGTVDGSAIAIWSYAPARKRALIDLCIGDDCMDRGTYAEEKLIRVLSKEAKELGADTLWLRTRRTESGLVFVPKYFPKLGFTAVPKNEQEDEDWGDLFGSGVEVKEEIVEYVDGLKLWVSTRGLEHLLEAANEWCKEMGAVNVNEIAENKEDFADYLGDRISQEERDKLLRW